MPDSVAKQALLPLNAAFLYIYKKNLLFSCIYDMMTILLQKVIEVLESLSGPGGLHENTLLLVMGDHGQTMNGDHGGGSAEEVYCFVFIEILFGFQFF